MDREMVGLRREAEVLCAALAAARHVVLEGPPGTGKSTLLRTVAAEAGMGVVFVEGNADLTPARLVGHHDPALVLASGYRPEAFVEGPLLRAMGDGMLLYLEELNRVPEETLNVVITALAEGEIHVPRVGRVEAAAGFRLVATMNPFDAVGTARIGQAITDRMCRVAIPYQGRDAEVLIVERVHSGPAPCAGLAVDIGRATREHRDLRLGASVRGAIDMVHLTLGLMGLRGEPTATRATLLDAALAAFSGRVRVDESSERRAEDVIAEIFATLYPDDDDGPQLSVPVGSPPRSAAPSIAPGRRPLEGRGAEKALREGSRRTRSRTELAAAHPSLDEISPSVGNLDEEAFERLRQRDPDLAAALLCDLAAATDRELRRRARALAARLFVRLAREGSIARRGSRRLEPQAGYRPGDLDLERTLERASGRPQRGDDLVVRDWQSSHRAACLLVDHSGSMRGLGMALAAVAAAGTALAAGRTDCSVVAFNREAMVLQSQGGSKAPEQLVDAILSLRPRGTTDLALGLRAASAQLGRAVARERVVILM
ncbi:MAG: AAA family ATPase, partial [Candidatus Dormibacteraeota bacterium]|nr:AAA family ATPase [Candidatus Dormibacteraeota bacterium]